MPVKTRASKSSTTTTNRTEKPTKKSKRSPIGSTVDGYSIPEVRKALDIIRRSWHDRKEGKFSLTSPVSDQDTIFTFGLRFMLGHHRKRHQRRAKKSNNNVG